LEQVTPLEEPANDKVGVVNYPFIPKPFCLLNFEKQYDIIFTTKVIGVEKMINLSC
jgi:hypothetical protein